MFWKKWLLLRLQISYIKSFCHHLSTFLLPRLNMLWIKYLLLRLQTVMNEEYSKHFIQNWLPFDCCSRPMIYWKFIRINKIIYSTVCSKTNSLIQKFMFVANTTICVHAFGIRLPISSCMLAFLEWVPVNKND